MWGARENGLHIGKWRDSAFVLGYLHFCQTISVTPFSRVWPTILFRNASISGSDFRNTTVTVRCRSTCTYRHADDMQRVFLREKFNLLENSIVVFPFSDDIGKVFTLFSIHSILNLFVNGSTNWLLTSREHIVHVRSTWKTLQIKKRAPNFDLKETSTKSDSRKKPNCNCCWILIWANLLCFVHRLDARISHECLGEMWKEC